MDALPTAGLSSALGIIGSVIIGGLAFRDHRTQRLPHKSRSSTLGALAGTPGLGLLPITLDSALLRAVATLRHSRALYRCGLSPTPDAGESIAQEGSRSARIRQSDAFKRVNVFEAHL